MPTDLCRAKINSYDDDNDRWRLANNILYDLVRKYPKHNNANETVAKMWIIGRTYAAAVERRPNRNDTQGDFYYDYVAKTLLDSKIDDKIVALKKYHTITPNNLPEILSVHKYLVDIFDRLTTREKRSLASKYLHFHLPHLFFIYDNRVASVITRFSGRAPRDLIVPEDSDPIYAVFCYKALAIYNELNREYSDSKTRVVDNILLRYCDEIDLQLTDED